MKIKAKIRVYNGFYRVIIEIACKTGSQKVTSSSLVCSTILFKILFFNTEVLHFTIKPSKMYSCYPCGFANPALSPI